MTVWVLYFHSRDSNKRDKGARPPPAARSGSVVPVAPRRRRRGANRDTLGLPVGGLHLGRLWRVRLAGVLTPAACRSVVLFEPRATVERRDVTTRERVVVTRARVSSHVSV